MLQEIQNLPELFSPESVGESGSGRKFINRRRLDDGFYYPKFMEVLNHNDPEKAFKMNAGNLHRISIAYATGAMLQATNCRHTKKTSEDCQKSSDNLNYFSIALAIVAGAVAEKKAAELFDILTKFAVENLPGFPKDLASRGLYKNVEMDFPDEIEDWKKKRS